VYACCSGIANFSRAAAPAFVRRASGAAGPTLRVGGDSSDYSLYWPSRAPLPARQAYAITDADLDMYAAALPTWGGRMVLGTSLFLQNNASWAAAHAAAVTARMGWALVQAVAGGDETRLKSFGLRFSSPVFPGETLRVEYWQRDGGEYAFRTKVKERDVVVQTGGRAVFVA
jgi:hypothetical protein